MRIRLLIDLPVANYHEMRAGGVYEVVRLEKRNQSNCVRWRVRSHATGTVIGVLKREAEVVQETDGSTSADLSVAAQCGDTADIWGYDGDD